MMRPRSRRAKVATGIVIGLCAAGLAAGVRAATSSRGLPAITVHDVTSQSQIQLPVDSYVPAFSTEVLIGRAVTKLADACLAKYGVAVPPVFLGFAHAPLSVLNDSTVQWLSVDSAEKYGFNPPQDQAWTTYDKDVWANGGILGVTQTQRQYLYGTGPAAQRAGSVPSGGCLGRAAATVTEGIGSVPELPSAKTVRHGAGATYYQLVQPGLPLQIEQAATSDAANDPRVKAAAAQWQSCMAKSGYHYATPTDALGDSRWAPGTTDAKSRRSSQGLQVAVATADARCQQQANVAGTRLAVLTGYQDQLISSNLGQLRTYQGEMAKLAANARAVLGGKQP